jgi:hypothetical protein
MDTKRFRVVGVCEQDADDRQPASRIYHNESFPRVVWQWFSDIVGGGLLFRELKTLNKLGRFDTTKKHIVEILVIRRC